MLPDLIAKPEAAQILNVAERTIVELIRTGKLRPVKQQRVGKPQVNMFRRDEVEALRQAREQKALVMASQVLPAVQRITDIPRPPEPQASRNGYSVPLWRKRWLTLDEASAYSGIGKGFIAGRIEGYRIGRNGSRVYRRADVDTLCP